MLQINAEQLAELCLLVSAFVVQANTCRQSNIHMHVKSLTHVELAWGLMCAGVFFFCFLLVKSPANSACAAATRPRTLNLNFVVDSSAQSLSPVLLPFFACFMAVFRFRLLPVRNYSKTRVRQLKNVVNNKKKLRFCWQTAIVSGNVWDRYSCLCDFVSIFFLTLTFRADCEAAVNHMFDLATKSLVMFLKNV